MGDIPPKHRLTFNGPYGVYTPEYNTLLKPSKKIMLVSRLALFSILKKEAPSSSETSVGL
jgi:hypothetical protein